MSERQRTGRVVEEGELFRLFTENVKDYAFVVLDADGRIQTWTSGAERLLGFREDEIVGQSVDVLFTPEDVQSGVPQREMEQALATGRDEADRWHVRKDGSRFWSSDSTNPLRDEAGGLWGFAMVIRDRTEWKTQELRQATQLAVTQVLAEASNVTDAAPRILQTVCDHLDWEVGGFWLADPQTQRLSCLDMWHQPAVEVGEFVEIRREQFFSRGTGLPGRVWSSGQPLWLSDLALGDDFPRLALAAQAGLRSAFAIPLMLGEQFLGVIEFLSRSIKQPETDLLGMMATVGGQLGQFIQRKYAEEALRASEERFRGVMEQAPFSMQVFSPDGRTLRVNRAWEELWGVSFEQIGDYNVLEDSQLAADDVREQIKRAFAGEAVAIPAVYYNPDQTLPGRTRHQEPWRWVSAVAYPLKDSSGQVREVILIHEDVTARKQIEDALRESEERFRGIVNHSIAGVAEVDLTGRFLFTNQRYCSIVGRSKEELAGLRMQDISHQDDLAANLVLFEQIGRDGQPYIIEKRYLRPDGTEVWVNNSVSALRGHDGQVRSIVAVSVDVTDRRRAEEARREGEERLRALIDNMPHGFVFRSVQNREDDAIRFAFLSAGVEQIFGITADEGLADHRLLFEAIHEEDQSRVLKEETRAIRTQTQFDSEFRIHQPSGELRWLHCRAAPNRHSSGNVVWEGISIDITDRKKTEQAFREQEDRLRLALDAGRMGTWNWDIRTGEVRWSSQLEAIHGLQPGTFPGTFEAYQKDMHPEDREHVLASIERAVSTGQEHHVEYRLVLPDGRIRWVEARGTVFRDESGKPMLMIGVCVEITPRKRAEEDLRFLADASRSLATLVDYQSTLQRVAGLAVPHFADWCTIYMQETPDELRQLAVAHVDPSKIQLAEEVRERWPPDPATPGGVYQVFQTGEPVLIEEVSESMLRQAAQDEEHFQLLRRLGLRSYMCVPLTVRENTIGVIAFIAAESGRRYTRADLALAEDLAHRAAVATENARLYATLRDEGRKKDEFLAMLAHELRNPIAPIRSGLDLLGLMGIDSDILGMMQQQTEHLVRLVDDLLDVSRIMRGKIELRREPTALSSVFARAVEAVRPLVEQQDQRLSEAVPPEPIWLDADPVRLVQVIANLLNNAAKYTEAGGHIWLSAEPASGSVLIRVRDSGIGISPELLPNVFELFTQDKRSIDRSQGGLGIGLTVVKNLVEMHGGNTMVRSEGSNRGSEFIVRLPTIANPQKRIESNGETSSHHDLRILVVDDNVPAAKMLDLLLRKIGNHQVFMAHHGTAALEAAHRHKPDLILLDIGLPTLDGYEVARQLRQHPGFDQMRLVALTGYGTEEDRRKSLNAGFDDHLVKPPGVEMLQKLLATVRPGRHRHL